MWMRTRDEDAGCFVIEVQQQKIHGISKVIIIVVKFSRWWGPSAKISALEPVSRVSGIAGLEAACLFVPAVDESVGILEEQVVE